MNVTWKQTAILIAVVAGLVLAVAIAAIPPAARSAGVAGSMFAAGRAMRDVRGITASGQPHPIGSTDHDRVRDYLLTRLRQVGLEPKMQAEASLSNGANLRNAKVTNILARIEGTEPGASILLAAHYDSAPEGPGAADDGAGVASILEIARAIKQGSVPRHSIVVLFDDAEESGLLGAELFVKQHAWARDVRAVINLEARGNQGQTAMFETSDGNGWLVRAYSRSVERPFANSIISALYKLLPNDTDLTVFKNEGGMQGVNLAFADRVWQYHTAMDTADHLDPRSLQHMGDQALAITRALAGGELRDRTNDTVYFDVLTLGMIAYPATWATVGAWIGALITILALWMVVRRARVSTRLIASSVPCLMLALVGSMLAAVAVTFLIRLLSGTARPWAHDPLPTWIAQVSTSIAVSSWVIVHHCRRVDLVGERAPQRLGAAPVSLWCASAVLWTVGSVLVAHELPGGSHLFTHAAVTLSGGLLLAAPALRGGVDDRVTWLALAGLMVVAFHWFTVLRILRTMVGADIPSATAFSVALVVTAAAPLLGATPPPARRWSWAGTGIVAAVSIMTAIGRSRIG